MNLEKKKKFIINIAYIALWSLILFFIFKLALVYLFPFFIGVFIAYFVQKPSEFIASKTKIKKGICAAALSVSFFILIMSLLMLGVWFLYIQVANFLDFAFKNSKQITEFSNTVFVAINRFFKNYKISTNQTTQEIVKKILLSTIEKTAGIISNVIGNFIKKIPSFLVSSMITIVATCYISKDFERLKIFVKGIVSVDFYNNAVEIKNIFINCIFKFLGGYLLLFLITVIELTISFFALGINKYIVLAVIIAIFDMLPVIGTGTILLPWSIISFIQNDFKIGIGLVIIYLLTVIVRNFFEPKIIGKQMEINPLFMLIFIFLGLKFAGVIGMVIFSICFTVLFTFFRQRVYPQSI